VYFVCAASDKDYMVEERAQRPVYCSILQYTETFDFLFFFIFFFLMFDFFLIFLVTCGCWGVTGLADE